MSPNKVAQPWWKLSRWTLILLVLFVSFYGAVLVPVYCHSAFVSRIFVYDADGNPVPYARLQFPTAKNLPDYRIVTDAKGESHDPVAIRLVEKVSGSYTFHRTFWNSKAPKMWILSTLGTQTFTVKDENGKPVPDLPLFLTFPPPRLYRSLHHAARPGDALNNREFRTDRNGVLAFPGVALSQRLQPHVEGTRFEPAKYVVRSVRVTTGSDRVNYSVRVARPATLTGTIRSASGKSVDYPTFFAAITPDGSETSGYRFYAAISPDSQGRFHSNQIPPGHYMFYSEDPWTTPRPGLFSPVKCTVGSGETTNITLHIP